MLNKNTNMSKSEFREMCRIQEEIERLSKIVEKQKKQIKDLKKENFHLLLTGC